MSRGRERAPSQNAYRGAAGATRTRAVQVTVPSGEVIAARIHDVIDAVADPELVQRLLAGELNRVAGSDGAAVTVAVPVVFHDPSSEVFVVVAHDSDRHRELTLRAELFTELGADRTAAVPRYVRDFDVVYGGAGLTAFLERKAAEVLATHRAAEAARDVERERRELTERRSELAGREAALDRRGRELDARQADLDAAGAEAARRLIDADRDAGRMRSEAETLRAEAEIVRAELARIAESARVAAPAPRPVARPTPAPALDPVTTPVRALPEIPDDETSPFELLEDVDAPELPPSADPITTITGDAPRPASDPWIQAFARGTAPAVFTHDDGRARIALRATGISGAALTASRLDVRLVVHRLPEYG